ncbi:MAG UNVERIFIED_CONTAM: hypothetical protein LVT10_10495 [Anaerolineae bacterium]|jgi:hypothetical protein
MDGILLVVRDGVSGRLVFEPFGEIVGLPFEMGSGKHFNQDMKFFLVGRKLTKEISFFRI